MVHLVASARDLARFIRRVKSADDAYVVLIAGASASGKSTEARRLVEELDRLGVPVVRKDGRPSPIEADMFYRDETGRLSELLGGNYDHPVEMDVRSLESTIYSLVEGREVYVPVYDFKESRRRGEEGPYVPDENPVIVVEGLYVIGLLGGISNLNVFVETKSGMELFVRRLLRDVTRANRDSGLIVKDVATALAMWNIYGKNQRRMADVILRSSYSVLEDRGEPSYQVKIDEEHFRAVFPSTWKEMQETRPVRVEDVVIGDVEEHMRGRLHFEGIQPIDFELSYRALVPSSVPFTRSLRISLPPSAYTAFVILSQIMGYKPKVFYREIHFLRKGNGVLKWYPERNMVEFDARDEKTILTFIRKVRGRVRLRSYYQDVL